MAPLLRLLADADLRHAVCALVTREQAGRLLAPACRATAALVRAEDARHAAAAAAADGAAAEVYSDELYRDLWRPAPPLWNLERVRARIAHAALQGRPTSRRDMCTGTLQGADTLQAVAAWLTREEAGRLLAPLCQAGRTLVRAADAAEDAGQKQIWLAGPPMWHIDRVYARIDARWPEDDHGVPGLAGVLRTLARMIENLVEYNCVERVFERREARAGRQASVLGCHRLLVLDAAHLLWHMEDWARRQFSNPLAHPTGRVYGGGRNDPKTLLVLNLLAILGLRPRRGRGMRFPPDPELHFVHKDRFEPLWNREYIAQSLSARGWH
jgi:hypothetical protein